MRPFEGKLFELTPEWEKYLADELGFDVSHLHVARARVAEDGRIAYPILSPLGTRRGYVLRSYDGGEPKALTRMDVEEPHSSYYTASKWEKKPEVWVVEDIPSAIRAARYVDCVAACGMPNDSVVNELAAHYRQVVWALDADATAQALRIHREYAILFEKSRVEVLDTDLKDMEEDELCQRLSGEGEQMWVPVNE